jgi:hypothetical protein
MGGAGRQIRGGFVNFKEHEKFAAFVLLGMALMTLALMLYLRPLPDSAANSGVLQILNMIIGAFIGAFGAAAGKLFDAKNVTVDNPPNKPVPVEPADDH